MASQEYTQIASDPQIKTKKTVVKFEYTKDEEAEKDKIDTILAAKESYEKSRASKEKEWTDSYKMYMSWIDTTRNPFLSNLFIPKVHEATEILSAFLIGTNQSIKSEPENNGDSYKAQAVGKFLEFLWRKVLKARIKVLTWIKQGVVFGNGILKVGWDAELNKPFLVNTAIEDVFFNYFEPDLQESEWIIHEVRKFKKDVEDNENYNETIRKQVIVGSDTPYTSDSSNKFSSYDKSLISDVAKDKVPLLEAWNTKDHYCCTLAPTTQGWRILKEVTEKDNIFYYADGEGKKIYFAPFVKLRFKTSPLANRAYDTGAIYPTVKIQKSFNDLINQYFDNVVMVNNAMWIKRRGARINPSELVRRPGGVISVNDINNDIRSDSPGDVKASVIEMLNRLDNEFQQASMVVNLLKGVAGGAEFSSEVTLGQQNVQNLLDMIDENIKDALSELGNMLVSLTLQNAEGNHAIKMFENDASVGILDFNPKDLVGRYDIKISADRSAGSSKVVRQKQLLDFISLLFKNPEVIGRYPNIIRKTLERWLEEAGINDTQFFFDESTPLKTDGNQPVSGEGRGLPQPGIDKLLTEASNLQAMQGGQGAGMP